MKIFEVKIKDVLAFKTLIDVLKDINNEINFDFCKENRILSGESSDDELSETGNLSESDDSGDSEDCNSEDEIKNSDVDNEEETKKILKIRTIDNTRTIFVDIKIDGINIDKLTNEKTRIGLNMAFLNKLLKSIDKETDLSLQIDEKDINKLIINIENSNIDKKKIFKLKLLEIDDIEFNIPETTFDGVILINSKEFNDLCKEMIQISEFCEIQCFKDKIRFFCTGDYAEMDTTYKINEKNKNHHLRIKFVNNVDKIKGVFEIRNLILLSKLATWSEDVEIYFKENYPLVVKYNIETLGKIILYISPKTDEEINFSDQEEFYSEDEDVELLSYLK